MPEDVRELVKPIIGHRLLLTYRADADGIERGAIVQALLDHVNVV